MVIVTKPAKKKEIVYTQKGTGLTREGVFNPKTNRVEDPFTTTEAIANKQMIAEQQAKDIEKIKQENRKITPEEQALSEQQKIEQTQLSNMLLNQPQPTVKERNVQAGLAAVNAISQTFGGGTTPVAEAQQIIQENAPITAPLINTGLTVLGKVTTQKVLGFSISDLFSKSNAGNIAELKGDASAIASRARLIYADASSRGGNQQEAIEQIRLSEEAVRQRYADAQLALNASPQDIAAGVDFVEDIYSNLVTLQAYRQSLERQQITGEKNIALMGNQPAEQPI